MRYFIDKYFGEVTTMPGSIQVGISHSVFTPKENRGKGNGRAAHRRRLEFLSDLGYDMLLCTVESTNTAQIQILLKEGWKFHTAFTSSKTGHAVYLYSRHLFDIKKKHDRGCDCTEGCSEHERCDAGLIGRRIQTQQFQNTEYQHCDSCGKSDAACYECDCQKRDFRKYPKTGFQEDSETAIHEEIERLRKGS